MEQKRQYDSDPNPKAHFVEKLKHKAKSMNVDWIAFREEVKGLLDDIGTDYYLKKSLTELRG